MKTYLLKLSLLLCLLSLPASSLSAAPFPLSVTITGPAGSVSFGTQVLLLANGNVVVTDPDYDEKKGAVYLYDGSGLLISALTGSAAGDAVGSGGVTLLANGNYVVASPNWANAGAANAGAVTWASAEHGVNGPVSPANSLVGSHAYDGVGFVSTLGNGNYVILSPSWNGGVGAATWADGATGINGPVTAHNSLVGSQPRDRVGSHVVVLANDNYLGQSPYWSNGEAARAGAVTWADGDTGIAGPVTRDNSLVGSHSGDQVGYGPPFDRGVTELSNGNYVVLSEFWRNGDVAGAGAATWGNGATGIVGPVTSANSLVGTRKGDFGREAYVFPLSNGNYLVGAPDWSNDSAWAAGAVTWANGATGITGAISTDNSLVGTQTADAVGGGIILPGQPGVVEVGNSNYLVLSPYWRDGPTWKVGAVTWGNGEQGVIGPVSAQNSLVGTQENDYVGGTVWAPGEGVWILPSGNYVVRSPSWSNGPVVDAGALTWGSGNVPLVGAVSAVNSLVGSRTGDVLLYRDAFVTVSGDLFVPLRRWDNGAAVNAGAVALIYNGGGPVGVVSCENSLCGTAPGGGERMGFSQHPARYEIAIGMPADNRVVLLQLPSPRAWLPLLVR